MTNLYPTCLTCNPQKWGAPDTGGYLLLLKNLIQSICPGMHLQHFIDIPAIGSDGLKG